MTPTFPTRSKQRPHRPQMFEDWAARFPQSDSAITNAIKGCAAGYKSFCEFHAKVSADETATPGARLVKSAKAANARILPLIQSLDNARANAQQHAAQLEETVASAYRPKDAKYDTVLRHQEIRTYLRTLPLGDKYKILDAARKANDEDTLIAIASSQAYLSGLPDQYQDVVRNELVQAHAPEQAAALKILEEQDEYAGQFRETLLQSVADSVDFKKADELIAAARDDVAA